MSEDGRGVGHARPGVPATSSGGSAGALTAGPPCTPGYTPERNFPQKLRCGATSWSTYWATSWVRASRTCTVTGGLTTVAGVRMVNTSVLPGKVKVPVHVVVTPTR